MAWKNLEANSILQKQVIFLIQSIIVGHLGWFQTDFGKNVIPNYLESGESVYAYEFKGYWKDVGTIESLWEANMEYIDPNNALDSRDRQWKIYSRNLISPPNFLGENAHVEDSLVVDGCLVDGTVKHSILSTEAQVRKDAVVEDFGRRS